MSRTPASVEELAGWVANRSFAEGEVLVSGSPADDADIEHADDVVSTSALAGVIAYEPAELTITVGAGTRVSELQRILADNGQWLPVAARAAERSAGGIVAAASPGPFDLSFGPIRRQLLACRVVSPAGEVHRWGRAVMKNVAGYDMRALMCGSRGRLGIIVDATFRVWTKAVVSVDVELPADTGPGSPLAVLCSTPAPEASWRPDAVVWRDDGSPRLIVRLTGTAESVDARRSHLRALADSYGWAMSESGVGDRPLRVSARQPDERVYRATVDRDYLPTAADRLREALLDRVIEFEAYPLAGIVRASIDDREDDGSALQTFADAVDGGRRVAAIAVERGSADDLETGERRRGEAVRRVEVRVVEALGGGPRNWRSDYL